jgi:hypothetical protein
LIGYIPEYKLREWKKDFINYFYPNKFKMYSDEEINKFFNKFKKEIEIKKKIYLRYIGRLYAYFS